jgi:hypothetical protein
MNTEIKEEYKTILQRVPPGDRWVFADGNSSAPIYPSLTDGLEAWFQNNGDTQFYIDAKKGIVQIVKREEVEKPVTKYSLYGED